MKWLFYVIVFVYMLYRTVYGAKVVGGQLTVEPVTYDDDDFLKVGGHKTISCKAANRYQRVEWVDPNGHIVKRLPGSRIFSQEHFVQSFKGRTPALVLTITNALVSDTGVYQCKSGDFAKNVSLCVIEPSDFTDTPAVMVSDLGRSITLSCQAKGEPEPSLLWKRNGEIINDENSSEKYKVMTKYNIHGFEGLLTVTSLEPEDSGVYSCVSLQESTQTEDCIHTETFNITLNINYAPIFEDANETQLVYGKNNEEVNIVCTANGYPAPTYRWFKDIDGEILYEFDKKQINLLEDGTQAVLTVIANQSTFGQRFRCGATNEYGDSYKFYTLLKMEKPRKPTEVNLFDATANTILLNVTWDDEIQFPITGFEIQYLKDLTENNKMVFPKEAAWRKSQNVLLNLDEPHVSRTDNGFIMGVDNLVEDSSYWLRVRVINEVGQSSWSEPGLHYTVAKDEVTTTEAPEAKPETSTDEGSMTTTTFYGIFFAGGIFVVSFVCMFAMRMVK